MLSIPAAAALTAPTALWQYLGPNGKPFRPFPAEAEALSVIRTPWPGLSSRGVPYPTVFCLNCGRRFGKTTCLCVVAWQALLAPDDMFGPPTVRLTADTEEHGRKVWDRFVWQTENTPLKALVAEHSRDRHLVTLKTGATFQLLSAANPSSLSGDGVTCWIVDEAQDITYPAWENLYPSTAERDGVIVMAGVSENDGPFREACFKGDSPDHPEYLRLCYPTAANPFVPRWRIDLAARTLPPSKFRQLYLAQWDSELGRIFRNLEGCIKPYPIFQHAEGWYYTEPHKGPNHSYRGGLDLARLQDWTVYTIWDKWGKLVAWDRFQIVSWELQKERIQRLSAAYGHPTTRVDSTGVGDPIYDDLSRSGMHVIDYKISSNQRKIQLVDNYAIRIGSGALSYPRERLFMEEHTRFEARKSKVANSNVVLYSAPAGGTDDIVLSGALAWWEAPPAASMLPAPSPDNYLDDDERDDPRDLNTPVMALPRQRSAAELI